MTNFYQNIHKSLIRNQDKVLVTVNPNTGPKEQFSGGEILIGISHFRKSLDSASINPGESLLLLLTPEDGLIHAILACMASGYNPVVPPKGLTKIGLLRFLKKEGIEYCALSNRANLLTKSMLRCFVEVLQVSSDNSIDKKSHPAFVDSPTVPALTSYSSGSTGTPKKLERSHEVLMAQHLALKEVFPSWNNQIDLPLFPNVVLHNLSVGVPTVFPALDKFDLNKLDAAQIVTQLHDEGVQSMSGNVYYFTSLVNYAKAKNLVFSEIQGLVIGGSPVSDVLLMEMSTVFINAKIYVVYGATEAEPIAIRAFKPNELSTELAGYSVGEIYHGITLEIKDPISLKVGNKMVQAGEILVSGDHVISGPSGWLETGDYGYLNDGSQLVLTARSGNEGVYQGVQHYMIEHACKSLKGLRNVAAIYTPQGFKVCFDGNSNVETVKKHLSSSVFNGLILSVEKHAKIPMDNRHLSKVLYRQLT